MAGPSGENGTILDVSAAVDLYIGRTVTIDELCDLMPDRRRSAITTSMNSIVRTSGGARGITVVRKANPKTWRINGPKPVAVVKEVSRPSLKKDPVPLGGRSANRPQVMVLTVHGSDLDGNPIVADQAGTVFCLKRL